MKYACHLPITLITTANKKLLLPLPAPWNFIQFKFLRFRAFSSAKSIQKPVGRSVGWSCQERSVEERKRSNQKIEHLLRLIEDSWGMDREVVDECKTCHYIYLWFYVIYSLPMSIKWDSIPSAAPLRVSSMFLFFFSAFLLITSFNVYGPLPLSQAQWIVFAASSSAGR